MMKAWHLCNNDKRLGFSDRRVIRTGRTYKVAGPVKCCQHGLHGSRRLIDALRYAQGEILCAVELTGQMDHQCDKVAATERKVVWMLNVSDILHEFACWRAERMLRAANVTDEQCWTAIRTKRRWLAGDATDAELSAARLATLSAARSAVAWSAQWMAYYAAHCSAAYPAASVAAGLAANFTANSAACLGADLVQVPAAYSAENRKLTKMVREARL